MYDSRNPPPLPSGLSEKNERLFREVTRNLTMSAGRAASIEDAFQVRQQLDDIREILRHEGLLQKSERSGLSRKHPLVDSEQKKSREARMLWEKAGLTWCRLEDGHGLEREPEPETADEADERQYREGWRIGAIPPERRPGVQLIVGDNDDDDED